MIVQIVPCEIAGAKVWMGGMLERSLGIRGKGFLTISTAGKVIDKKDPTWPPGRDPWQLLSL